MKAISLFTAFAIACFSIAGCRSNSPTETQSTTTSPLVGTWEVVKGGRQPGQVQFQADQYFRQITFRADGQVFLLRDIGTKTEGTWMYDKHAEALRIRYKGGHDGAGFSAQRLLEIFSHITLDGNTLTFPELGSQKMTYKRSLKDG